MRYLVENNKRESTGDSSHEINDVNEGNQQADLRVIYQQQYEERERLRLAAQEEICEAVRSVIHQFPYVRRAYLIHSTTPPISNTPDIDVAIEGSLHPEDYFVIWEALGEIRRSWKVDVVEMDNDAYTAARVRECGVVFFEREDTGTDNEV